MKPPHLRPAPPPSSQICCKRLEAFWQGYRPWCVLQKVKGPVKASCQQDEERSPEQPRSILKDPRRPRPSTADPARLQERAQIIADAISNMPLGQADSSQPGHNEFTAHSQGGHSKDTDNSQSDITELTLQGDHSGITGGSQPTEPSCPTPTLSLLRQVQKRLQSEPEPVRSRLALGTGSLYRRSYHGPTFFREGLREAQQQHKPAPLKAFPGVVKNAPSDDSASEKELNFSG